MMTDDEFVLKCQLPDEDVATLAALLVRRAAARMGSVDLQFVLPDDDYPGSLEMLPGWDSIDWVEFAMALEEQLDMEISDEDLQAIVGSTHATIRDLAHGVYRFLMSRRESGISQSTQGAKNRA